MDVDEVNSSASSTRRPKAKARPRRGGEADGGGIIIIRYDTAHDCRNMVRNHRGKFHVGGAELKQLGLASRDEVVESGGDQQVIKCMTSTQNMDLPQRGDAPKFPPCARQLPWLFNPSYQNVGDNVRCGLLELLPLKGQLSLQEGRELDSMKHSLRLTASPGSNTSYCIDQPTPDFYHSV